MYMYNNEHAFSYEYCIGIVTTTHSCAKKMQLLDILYHKLKFFYLELTKYNNNNIYTFDSTNDYISLIPINKKKPWSVYGIFQLNAQRFY